jgi:hypothetical protein
VERKHGDELTKRAVLTALLLVVSASAAGEWVKVTETPDRIFYVDPSSIISNGRFREASVVQDLSGPERDGVRSRRVLYEVDCAGSK